MVQLQLNSAYNSALKFAKSHYENFPVVSFLIKKSLRKHIAIIYWFARTADDIADEGKMDFVQRISKLENFELRLKELINGNFTNDFEYALHNTIIKKKLTPAHFYNLLKAFKQDVVKTRFDNFDELLNYCNRSANPVGRLVLELHDIRNERLFLLSDKICTALQLTNFYQDVSNDIEKGRIYFPTDEMKLFSVSEKEFEKKEFSVNLQQLVKHQVLRAEKLFYEGEELLNFLSGRLKLEIKWTIFGGLAILNKIKNNGFNIYKRPVLTKTDFLKLLFKSFN